MFFSNDGELKNIPTDDEITFELKNGFFCHQLSISMTVHVTGLCKRQLCSS